MIRKLLLMLLCAAPAFGQGVPVALMPVARQQFADNNGVPLAGGCVSFFNAGTTTPAPTYVDILGINLTTNPIVLDSAGRATIYGANQEYKVQLNAAPTTGICSSSNLGALIWVQDNVSPFQVIIGTQTIIFAGVTIDPVGQAGMMDYRSDIPCFRTFTTIWDCLVRLNDTQTLSNKTLPSPTITAPTVTGGTFTTPALTSPTLTSPSIALNTAIAETYANDTVAGTTTNFLVIFSGAQAGAVRTFCTSGCANPVNAGALGICISNCTTSGNAQIAVSGVAPCAFDGATTFTDYVGVSQSSLGKCTDIGAAYPTGIQGQLVGRVLSTNGGAGTYNVSLMIKPEVRGPTASVAKVDLTTLVASQGNTALFTPSVTGFFRFSCDEVITQAATTSSTLPQCNLAYTDGDSSVAQSNNICTSSTSNLVGQLCGPGSNANSFAFFAKGGVAIAWSTSGYTSVGATPMQYALHVRLEGPL